jgi:hypothetical protein
VRLARASLATWWHAFADAFADAFGRFVDETAFRLVLAYDVLAGRVPLERGRRWWSRAVETPVLVDAYGWTDGRLLFSVLVWPPLESSPFDAARDHEERTRQIKESFGRVCADRAWSVRFDTDYGLRWDHERACWVNSSEAGHAYDGARLYDHAKGGL